MSELAVVLLTDNDHTKMVTSLETIQACEGAFDVYVLQVGTEVWPSDLSEAAAGPHRVLHTQIKFGDLYSGRAQNAALQLCSEARLAFCLAGDRWAPDHLTVMSELDGDIILPAWRHGDLESPTDNFRKTDLASGPRESWIDSNMLVDRRALIRALGIEPWLGGLQQDYGMIARACQAGLTVVSSPAVTVEKAALPPTRQTYIDPEREFYASDKRGAVKWRGLSSIAW